MMVVRSASALCEPADERVSGAVLVAPSFEAIYRRELGFVWRTAQRLGAPAEALDDVVQDVFLVVHRKVGQLAPDASVRAWLFTIVRRVVRDRWRATARSRRAGIVPFDPQQPEPSARVPSPDERLSQREAKAVLYQLLETLDGPKREVFVLAELEGMTAPEIAAALEQNLNTIYSRLRAARAEFEQALARRTERGEP